MSVLVILGLDVFGEKAYIESLALIIERTNE